MDYCLRPETLFRWIAPPVLKNLEIRGPFKTDASLVVTDLFWTRLTSYSTMLRSLSFYVSGMTYQDLKKWAYLSLPSLDDNDYEFRQRVGKVLESWTPLLGDLTSRRRWTLSDDYLTLRTFGPTVITSTSY